MKLAKTWEGHHVAVKDDVHTGDVILTRWNTYETVQKIYPKIEHDKIEPQSETLE